MTFAYIPNCIVLGQFKGGTGKTTLTTNCAGLLAASGKRVLVVDFDPQDHCAMSLGIDERGSGRELRDALEYGDPLAITKDVRPGLDLVRSGPELAKLFVGGMSPQDYRGAFLRTLAEPAKEYDLVLVDTPPGQPIAMAGLLGAAGALLAITDPDHGSVQTMKDQLVKTFAQARELNPHVKFLGVVINRIAAGDVAIERDIRTGVARLFDRDPEAIQLRITNGDPVDPAQEPVFRSLVRAARKLGADARKAGTADRLYFEQKSSKNAEQVVGDLVAVSTELFERFSSLASQTKENAA